MIPDARMLHPIVVDLQPEELLIVLIALGGQEAVADSLGMTDDVRACRRLLNRFRKLAQEGGG